MDHVEELKEEPFESSLDDLLERIHKIEEFLRKKFLEEWDSFEVEQK